jgi:hypothetical protein
MATRRAQLDDVPPAFLFLYWLDDIVWLLVALLQGLAWSLWRCDGEG